ncbi:MAG: hypothetical protein DIU71_08805 [Proteobacteria bacterium]|nr:MAG: hypothetical protein DIU71_08805 [Pseudomonadota bacterium]
MRHPAAWLTIGWSLVACAIIGSLMPGNAVSKLGLFKIGDKLLHAGMYAALAIWFTGIYPRSRYVAIAVGLFLLGVLAELGQGAMHAGREPSLGDVVANSVGIAVGVGLALAGLGGWARRVEDWVVGRS